MSDLARNNRIGCRAHMAVVICMEIFMVLQYLIGARTLPELVITLVLGFFAPVAERICYRKNPDTTAIKHFMSYGFAVYYTYVLFTATNQMVFAYVIPLLLVIAMYNDTAYTLKINIGTITENLVVTIWGAKTGAFGYVNINTAIVQNIVMILVGFFSVWTAKVINDNHQAKINRILEVSGKTDASIRDISGDLEQLVESSLTMKNAMTEIASGINNTAEAVQEQLLMTGQITEETEGLDQATGSMQEKIYGTINAVNSGASEISCLIQRVDLLVANSQDTQNKVEALKESMENMNKVTQLIDNIAFQTQILALNANVEAARAGDAGRGFAVVAEEVSNMSGRTATATSEIMTMIESVTIALEEVATAVSDMTVSIMNEKDDAQRTGNSFAEIKNNTDELTLSIEQVMSHAKDLSEANRSIVNSVETISSVAEEVAALTEESVAMEENNNEVIGEINAKMEALVEEIS